MTEPLNLTPGERQRWRAADFASFGGMCRAAIAIGAGCAMIDGAMAIWNPGGEGVAYNCFLDLEASSDPSASWQQGHMLARAARARRFGIGVNPELVSWATPQRLDALGLTLEYVEEVWLRRLSTEIPNRPLPEGLIIQDRDIDPARFAHLLNRGWEEAPDHARGWLYASAIGLPGWTHYLVQIDGVDAAAGALSIQHGFALLMVATTDPAYRGRGAQSALIGRRLADAVAAGCDLALSETVDDNSSPRNMERFGFSHAHDRPMYYRQLIDEEALAAE